MICIELTILQKNKYLKIKKIILFLPLLSFKHTPEVCLHKVNGYISRGSNSVILIFASLLNGSLLLKGKNLLLRSKFFPLRVDFILEGFYPSGNQTGSQKKLFPFV